MAEEIVEATRGEYVLHATLGQSHSLCLPQTHPRAGHNGDFACYLHDRPPLLFGCTLDRTAGEVGPQHHPAHTQEPAKGRSGLLPQDAQPDRLQEPRQPID